MLLSRRPALLFPLLVVAVSSCASDDGPIEDDPAGGDLPLGDVSADDLKADGDWGFALDCKPLPALPPLVHPKITLSIDGLTLRLTDATTGFDKVYPVGAGAIEQSPTSGEFRESLSNFPASSTGRNDFEITPSTIQPCKTWWTDSSTGTRVPVFAGLPFLSFHGNYGIHGPIDGYRAANGGQLRRGYVSHGCFRMEGADILEVYARIKGVARVPVHLQREPERRADRTKVDVASKWVGAACSEDAECGYANGFCATNPLTQQGFCSARCTTTCADRKGYPSTFCVADPATPGAGMCVAKAQAENFECRPYDHFQPAAVTRFNQPAVAATACLPASPGWVGDHCATSADCTAGTSCQGASPVRRGVCTSACDRYCADQPGYADTFCAAAPALSIDGAGSCVRQCTPSSNAAECPTDMECRPAPRNGQAGVVRNVCLPRAL